MLPPVRQGSCVLSILRYNEVTRIRFLDLLRRTGIGFHVELEEEDFAQIRRCFRISICSARSTTRS